MNLDRLSETWPLIRDVTIAVVALGLLVYEAVFYSGPVRPELLVLYSGLLVSPAFIRGDKRLRDSEQSKSQEVEP